MAEYIVVKHLKRLEVYVNGQLEGMTNEILQVETGTHVITVAEGSAKTSESHDIRNTNFHEPKIVTLALQGDNNVPDYDSDDSGDNNVPDH